MFFPVKILLAFPHYIPPYHVFNKSGEIGKSKVIFDWRGHTFIIQNSTYILRQHTGNIGSLTKDGCQIAHFRLLDTGQVQIQHASDDDLLFVFAFSLMFFAFFHADKKWKHTSIIFNDEYAELAQWKH